MSLNQEEAQPRWEDLAADPQYAELAQYVADKKKKHRDDLAEFRDSVSANLPPGAKDTLDALVESACHPPPGCGG